MRSVEMASDGIVVCPLTHILAPENGSTPEIYALVVFTNRILRLRSLSGTSLPSAQFGEETRFHEKTERTFRVAMSWRCTKRQTVHIWGMGATAAALPPSSANRRVST